jgi:flagellar motor switch protein FliG
MERTELHPDKLTGPQKAAIMFLSMGEEFASEVFRDLDEKSIKKIGRYMSEINYIPSVVLKKVFDEFLANISNDVNLVVSGKDFLQDVVNKTLDKETAREVFRVIDSKVSNTPFSDLEYVPTENIYNILQGEHPQTIALILSYIPQEKAAELLSFFPQETQGDIALRIVQIKHVDTEIVGEIDEAIKNDLSKVGMSAKKFDGVEKLANILNEVDGATEEALMSCIENEDSDLADMIRQKMFIFEDLLSLDDRHFRDLLQNIDNQVLARALRTSSEEMKKKILGNLSQRASEMLQEDIEVMGPVKLSEVEEAQQEILRTAKRLESEGRIVLGKGKEDVFV